MSWFRRRRRDPDSGPSGADARPLSSRPYENPEWTHPDRWRLIAWDQPDLTYADAHARERYRDWELYVPYLELVQCGDTVKPALFFAIGQYDFHDWATTVEATTLGWNWFRTMGSTPYVVIDFHILFLNGSRTPIGRGGVGQITVTTKDANRYAHQLRSRALLDPGDPNVRRAIEAWVAGPAPTMLFFVEQNFRATAHLAMDIGPSTKQDLARVLREATDELGTDGIVPGSFSEACALLQESLPSLSVWR